MPSYATGLNVHALNPLLNLLYQIDHYGKCDKTNAELHLVTANGSGEFVGALSSTYAVQNPDMEKVIQMCVKRSCGSKITNYLFMF